MHWWPEGFHETSELDFRVLLDEMVELGVLRRVKEGRYTLRNANILLLLGSEEEIESVLIRDREPSVEFASDVFRPPFRSEPTNPRRNPLTFQQLSKLLSRENTVHAIAGTPAGGIFDIVPGLQDYLGQSGNLVIFNDCSDRFAFKDMLERALEKRKSDSITVMVIPSILPWSYLWINDAKQKISRLTSDNKFVSLLFLADPQTLWGAISDAVTFESMDIPWMSLLPWQDRFVSYWLSDQPFLNNVDRKRILNVTGYWSKFLVELVDGCSETREFRIRLDSKNIQTCSQEKIDQYVDDFGLDTNEPHHILNILAQLDESVDEVDLAALAECNPVQVRQVLRWADLLGLVKREGGNFYNLDPIVKIVLTRMDA